MHQIRNIHYNKMQRKLTKQKNMIICEQNTLVVWWMITMPTPSTYPSCQASHIAGPDYGLNVL